MILSEAILFWYRLPEREGSRSDFLVERRSSKLGARECGGQALNPRVSALGFWHALESLNKA